MAAGGVLALVHAVFSISLRADQIVSGFAINFLALGITGYIFLHHYGEQGTPDGLPAVPDVSLPIDWIPFFGPALDKLNLLVWVALLLVFVVWLFVFRTPAGLRMRSVGENPRAAATVGISVYKTRYLAVIASGVLAAMGGAFLSIGFVHSFNQNMTAGRGFIALAVVIVGKWRPGAALAAALMFGFSQALSQRLVVFSESSATLLQALPYVVTLIAVAGLVGRSIAAGGRRRAVLEGVERPSWRIRRRRRGSSCSTTSRRRSTRSAWRSRRSAAPTSCSTSTPPTASRRSCSGPSRSPTAARSAPTPAFAERHGLPGRTFEPSTAGRASQGAKSFLDTAVEAVEEADHLLVEIQDSMMPVEVGDAQLRAGLAEARELVGPLAERAHELVRVLGR